MKIKVAIIAAMEEEVSGLIKALILKPQSLGPFYDALPFKFYRGSYKGELEITLGVAGKDPRHSVDNIGTEPAAVLAFAMVKELKPDILINIGTAGGFAKKGASIGKVYLSDRAFFFHDHKISIRGWDKFGIGDYPSFAVHKLAEEVGLDTANISSGNSLDFTAADLERIEQSGAALKEMEAAAIAWVAYTCQIRFFAIKAVTNLLDVSDDSAGEFQKNFTLAVKSLTGQTLAVIDRLAHRLNFLRVD
jgi:nucleoside phosphorylase